MKNSVEKYSTIHGQASDLCSNEEKHRATTKEVWVEFQGCVNEVSYDVEALKFVLTGLKSLRSSAREIVQNPNPTKSQVIANLFGVKPAPVITVQPLLQSNNKGSRKRILSSAEKSVDDRKRVLRMCKSCGVMSFHDSRNCPKKGLNNNVILDRYGQKLDCNPLMPSADLNIDEEETSNEDNEG